MTAKPRIEFVETHEAIAPDGGPRAASYFVFMVGTKQVAVEVYLSAIMTRDGKNLPPEKIKAAAQSFLESEVERVGSNFPDDLVLDEHAMDSVLNRLGWPSRF
jgi:hypothetical protein